MIKLITLREFRNSQTWFKSNKQYLINYKNQVTIKYKYNYYSTHLRFTLLTKQGYYKL